MWRRRRSTDAASLCNAASSSFGGSSLIMVMWTLPESNLWAHWPVLSHFPHNRLGVRLYVKSHGSRPIWHGSCCSIFNNSQGSTCSLRAVRHSLISHRQSLRHLCWIFVLSFVL